MATQRRFQQLTDEEKVSWLADFQAWLVVFESKPVSDSLFEKGLELISVFSYAEQFVSSSLMFRDYSRRIGAFRRLVARVTADARKFFGHQVDIGAPALLKPRVGRPTKIQAAARELAKKKALELEQSRPALFESPRVLPEPMARPRRLSLNDIRWILSERLQSRVDLVRGLRAGYEEACTRAKQMAEDGRTPSEIEPYAKAAAEGVEAVEDIYAAVDDELQVAYVRLKEDKTYIEQMAALSRYDNKELRSFLRPYWDKLSLVGKEGVRARVAALIKVNDSVQAAEKAKSDDKKRRVAAIIKYLRRTDKPNTLKRLEGMEKKLSALSGLIGSEAEIYYPLLVAAREDYEKNIKPLQRSK